MPMTRQSMSPSELMRRAPVCVQTWRDDVSHPQRVLLTHTPMDAFGIAPTVDAWLGAAMNNTAKDAARTNRTFLNGPLPVQASVPED
jgi:hypothetical protein